MHAYVEEGRRREGGGWREEKGGRPYVRLGL